MRPLDYVTFLGGTLSLSFTHSVNNFELFPSISTYSMPDIIIGSEDTWGGICGDDCKMVPTGIGYK